MRIAEHPPLAEHPFVDCLGDNGLEVVIDGVKRVGPYPPEIAERAWQAGRDLFAQRELLSPLAVADRIPPVDCMATKGWLIAFLRPTDVADPQLVADRRLCAAG